MNMRFILVLMLLSACDDFDPRSLLQAPRVVGVVAEPPAAQFGDTVQLTSIEYGANIAKREWSICLLSLGPFKDYECVNETLIIPIDETDKSVSFTIDETLLAPLFMFLETDGAELAESLRRCLPDATVRSKLTSTFRWGLRPPGMTAVTW